MRVINNLFLGIKYKGKDLTIRKLFFEEELSYRSEILFAKYFKGMVITIENYRNKISILSIDRYCLLNQREVDIDFKIRNVEFYKIDKSKFLLIKLFYENEKVSNYLINEFGEFVND